MMGLLQLTQQFLMKSHGGWRIELAVPFPAKALVKHRM